MKYFSYIALLFSVLLTNVSCEIIADELPTYEETSIVRVGDEAPEFTIESIDGEWLAMPCNEPTLLILFSHTCPDCQKLMGDLQEWLNGDDEEHNIIAISRGGTTEEIAAFRDEHKLGFKLAADEDAEIYYKYATMYVPRCYVVDSNGMVRLMTYEYQSGDVEKLMSELKKLY